MNEILVSQIEIDKDIYKAKIQVADSMGNYKESEIKEDLSSGDVTFIDGSKSQTIKTPNGKLVLTIVNNKLNSEWFQDGEND